MNFSGDELRVTFKKLVLGGNIVSVMADIRSTFMFQLILARTQFAQARWTATHEVPKYSAPAMAAIRGAWNETQRRTVSQLIREFKADLIYRAQKTDE